MRFRCRSCGKVVSVDAVAGEMVACGLCQAVVQVPEAFHPNFVIGDYAVIKEIGRGRMGPVYQAYQLSLEREVVLKVLNPDMASNAEFIMEFFREARIAAKISHPNVVQSYSVNETEGCYFLVAEYINGEDLLRAIKRCGRLGLDQVLSIAMQVAVAMNYAHRNFNLCHQAIKPQNILLTHGGQAKLSDLALTETNRRRHSDLPLYSAPEQLLDLKADIRSDIYSLGVTIYHALTGISPFAGHTLEEVRSRQLKQHPAPASDFVPDLPADVCQVLDKMMAKHPEDRYVDMAELGEDLQILRDRYCTQRRARPKFFNFRRREPASMADLDKRRRSRWLWTQLLLAALGMAVLGLVVYETRHAAPVITVQQQDDSALLEFFEIDRELRIREISAAKAELLRSRLQQFMARNPQFPELGRCRDWSEQLDEVLVRAGRAKLRQVALREEEESRSLKAAQPIVVPATPSAPTLSPTLGWRDVERRIVLERILGKASFSQAAKALDSLEGVPEADRQWVAGVRHAVQLAETGLGKLETQEASLKGLDLTVEGTSCQVQGLSNGFLLVTRPRENVEKSIQIAKLEGAVILQLLSRVGADDPAKMAAAICFWWRNLPEIGRLLPGGDLFAPAELDLWMQIDLQVHLDAAEQALATGDRGGCYAELLAVRRKYSDSPFYLRQQARINALAAGIQP